MAEQEGKKPEDLVEELADGSASFIPGDDAAAEVETVQDEDDEQRAVRGGALDDDDPDAGPTEAEELRMAADEAAREAIRARRRKERKDKKAAQSEREAGLRRELAQERQARQQLEERFNVMDRRTSGAELAQLDNAIAAGETSIGELKTILATAASTGNGAALADATEKYVTSTKRLDELRSIRQRIATPQRQAAPTISPDVANRVRTWAADHPWYDVRGANDDSAIVLGLDSSLVRDGYRPDTDAYWQELDRRCAKYLPHRFEAAPTGTDTGKLSPDGKKPVRSPVAGSGRAAANSGTNGRAQYKVSPERVQALKDAGMWEDPVQRNAMIKDFMEYDRKEAARSATK